MPTSKLYCWNSLILLFLATDWNTAFISAIDFPRKYNSRVEYLYSDNFYYSYNLLSPREEVPRVEGEYNSKFQL